METDVLRGQSKFALGTAHCQVCVVFLGQPVPVISTPRGYALFCETCALGRNAPSMRVRAHDARALQLHLDPAPASDPAVASEEE